MITVILFVIFIGSLIMTFRSYWREQKFKDVSVDESIAEDKLTRRNLKRAQKKIAREKSDREISLLEAQKFKKIWGTIAVFAFLIMLLVSPLNFDRP